MANNVRWWWIAAAPISVAGVYIGKTDKDPIDVDESIYELLGSALPAPKLMLSSPLKRASMVAQKLHAAKEFDEKIEALEAFREQDFGVWEGQKFETVQAIIEAENRVAPEDIATLTPDDGESYADVIKRVGSAIDIVNKEALKSDVGQPVDVICTAHISTIRAAIGKALDIKPTQSLQIHMQPLSLTILEHHKHFGWLVHTTGWTPWPMVR